MSELRYDEILQAVESDEPVAIVTIVRGKPLGEKLAVYEDGRVHGTFGSASLDQLAIKAGQRGLADDESGMTTLADGIDAFVDVIARSPEVIMIGAVHTAIALGHIAKALGFRVAIVDPRERFATRERFPHADEIIHAWPDEALAQKQVDSRTYIAILTHDPKFDEPALVAALGRPARYVGAIGSRKTSADRIQRLRAQGMSDEQLARIHAPIGIDIGARTPEEIALSIAAEMIAVRRGRGPKSRPSDGNTPS